MAWADAAAAKAKASGAYVQVPCMCKMFDVPEELCSHCVRARALFEKGEDDAGKSAYAKKAFFGWVQLIRHSGNPELNGAFRLMHFPVRPVTRLLEKCSVADESLRWPTPTDLDAGHQLVFSKKKGAQYPDYEIDYIAEQLEPLRSKWEQLKDRLRSPLFPANVLYVRKTSPEFIFKYNSDMKEGDTLRFRLLPAAGNEELFPLGLLWLHNVQAPSDLDMAWESVQWDATRVDEVREIVGMRDGDTGGVDDGLPF